MFATKKGCTVLKKLSCMGLVIKNAMCCRFAALAVIWDPNWENRDMHLCDAFVKFCKYQPMITVIVSVDLPRGNYHLLNIQYMSPLFEPALRLSILEEMSRGRSY
jgi:hypothetical protein